MAILAAMQSAALVVAGRRPDQFFGSVERLEQEISDLANEVAEDIARYQDWQALQATATMTGDGAQTSFALPADYSRMLKNAEVRPAASALWGYTRYDNVNELARDRAGGYRTNPGSWIITGGAMQFYPAPRGATIFPYISSAWARDANGLKSQFTDDADEFVLPERLLKLGLIWRWRENKKLDATGDQEAFTKALDEYAFSDGGSRVYRYNGRSSFPGTHLAFPGVLGGDGAPQWSQTEW